VSTIGDEALLEYIRGINERLRRLEEHAERVGQQLGVPFGDPSASGSASASASAGSGVTAEVVALAQGGKKIEAIKRYRELTGVGLREAKDVVDGI
jgi:large subunit ribosomal protein L7/L12